VVVAALTARVRPDVQVVDVGQSATFLCVVAGSPRPALAWYKDAAPVDDRHDARLTLSADRRRLTVRRVFRHDAGVYQCLVENNDDSHQSAGRLIIGGIVLTSVAHLVVRTLLQAKASEHLIECRHRSVFV